MIYIKIFYYIAVFVIFWAMFGYEYSLKFLHKFTKKKIEIKTEYLPSVTLMIVAHNEEKVIENKLINAISLDYPNDKLEILVSSDNSSDNTNAIVEDFIRKHLDKNIRLYKVMQRKGKTNAQNEAQKTVNSEILVMTDANSIFEINALKELVSSFSNDNIAYVCGQLKYSNSDNNISGKESAYWNKDLKMREIESNIKTITAGNGAIYACRNILYVDVPLIESHDSAMPRYYALKKLRAIYNPNAIAYEKAGEVIEDEFKRKVRMNRTILRAIMPDLRILNFFKYGWYTYFYLGHRTSRYLLWFMHSLLLITNYLLISNNLFYLITFSGQVLFYIIGLLTHIFKIKNKYFGFVYYYCMTILAQWFGVFNIITRKNKPFWEKAESTR